MGAENDPGLVIDQVRNCGKTGMDPGIVFDCTIPVHGHIEINPHEHPFPANFNISHRFFLHGFFLLLITPDTGARFCGIVCMALKYICVVTVN